MSRSNPTEIIPHPCAKWFNWNGEKGNLKWYDKEAKKNVEQELPFSFILLDELSTITGWHEPSEASLYSNEVKDTRHEPFVVRSFGMKEIVAEGFYREIRDKVVAAGGKFTTNIYLAFNDSLDAQLKIGSLQLHGAALSAWMNFKQEDRKKDGSLWKKDIEINEYEEGKKGSVKFRVPIFSFNDLDTDADKEAVELDRKLQKYLASYFKRTRTEQAQPQAAEVEGEPIEDRTDHKPEPKEDEIPF